MWTEKTFLGIEFYEHKKSSEKSSGVNKVFSGLAYFLVVQVFSLFQNHWKKLPMLSMLDEQITTLQLSKNTSTF